MAGDYSAWQIEQLGDLAEEEEELAAGLGGRRQALSKEQQIYGIWADEDSDDERARERDRKRARGRGGSQARRLAAQPLLFVGGASENPEAPNERESKMHVDGTDRGDPAEETASEGESSGSENDEGGARVGDGGAGRSKYDAFFFAPAPVQQGLRGALPLDNLAGGVLRDPEPDAVRARPDFERHTTGFGSKMLQKMGFAGKLGKRETGISRPIEAHLRRERAGLGPMDRVQAEQFAEIMNEDAKAGRTGAAGEAAVTADGTTGEQRVHREARKSWKKHAKKKVLYKTAEEIISDAATDNYSVNAAGETSSGLRHQKDVLIVDMRGDEVRSERGLQHLHEMAAKGAARMDGSRELLYNLGVLTARSEGAVQSAAAKLSREQRRKSELRESFELLDASVKREKKQIARVEEVLFILQRSHDKTRPQCPVEDRLSPQSLARVFQMLQDNYAEEYSLFQLVEFVPALLYPVSKPYFANWDALGLDDDPSPPSDHEVAETINLWSEVLSLDKLVEFLWGCLLPPIRAAVTNRWHPRQAVLSRPAAVEPGDGDSVVDPALSFLQRWQELMPKRILAYVLRDLVLPRLVREINDWDPRTDRVPLHAWVHPWLPYLHEELAAHFPAVRQKFENTLKDWYAGDESALVVLAPWATVFDSTQWNRLLSQRVIPRMIDALNGFPVSRDVPSQRMESGLRHPIRVVLSFEDIVPRATLGNLLCKSFFPRWLTVLRDWLSDLRGPKGNDSSQWSQLLAWYEEWKKVFGNVGAEDPAVRKQLTAALDMINAGLTTRSSAR